MRLETRFGYATASLVVAVAMACMLAMPGSLAAGGPDRIAAPDFLGWVTDAETGAPRVGVTVTLYRVQAGHSYTYVDDMVTAPDGGFTFYGLTIGNDYQAYVEASTTHRTRGSALLRYSGSPCRGDIAQIPNIARFAGRSRYSTAVEIARRGWDRTGAGQWEDVKAIVIASGEDRAAADPLAAGGIVYAYEAPLFLVKPTGAPPEVLTAVSEIVAYNGAIDVYIIGGTSSVPNAVFNQMDAYVGGQLVSDRILATGSRYDLAAAIARRMKAVDLGSNPSAVLIANGADPTKFFDALALSPISANNGYPILLVSATGVPPATASALKEFSPTDTIIGGGPNTVSEDVFDEIDDYAQTANVERWWGSNRYKTALAIADKASDPARLWLRLSNVGVAAKLPDALAGGAMMGKIDEGPIVVTSGTVLTPEVQQWMETHDGDIGLVDVYGGQLSITDGVKAAIKAAVD